MRSTPITAPSTPTHIHIFVWRKTMFYDHPCRVTIVNAQLSIQSYNANNPQKCQVYKVYTVNRGGYGQMERRKPCIWQRETDGWTHRETHFWCCVCSHHLLTISSADQTFTSPHPASARALPPLNDEAALSNLLTQQMRTPLEDEAKWCSCCIELHSDGPRKQGQTVTRCKRTNRKPKIDSRL